MLSVFFVVSCWCFFLKILWYAKLETFEICSKVMKGDEVLQGVNLGKMSPSSSVRAGYSLAIIGFPKMGP